jgi:hypothetical protein
MEHAAGESDNGSPWVDFDQRLQLEFHGSRITSGAGLLAYRARNDPPGLTGVALPDGRRGKTTRRQSVFGRLAGYEDANHADRLAHDPAMGAFAGRTPMLASSPERPGFVATGFEELGESPFRRNKPVVSWYRRIQATWPA